MRDRAGTVAAALLFGTAVLYQLHSNEQSIVRSIWRVPIVNVRALLSTPEAQWPAVMGLLAVGVAWWLSRSPTVDERRDRALGIIGYVIGVAAILWFLQWGNIDWNQNNDWRKEWTYYSALHEAAGANQLPYLLRAPFQGTDRYLANLETVVAPDAILLKAISVRSFFLIHALLLFTLGYAALVALKRELGLSAFTWTVFVLVFLLNGHITSHLGTGHTQWVGYLLLPWVFLCLVRVARDDDGRANAVALSLTLAAMITIGAWHVFIWSLLFAAAVCVSSRRRILFLAKVVAVVLGLAAVRLLPALTTFGGGNNVFLGGFTSVPMLLEALVGASRASGHLEAWEFDTFIGWGGFALVCLGMFRGRVGRAGALFVPSLVLVALSMFRFYELTLFRLPGFVSERVVSRFAVVGVLGLLVMGCVRLDEWLISRPGRWSLPAVGVLFGGGLLVIQLVLHATAVRPLAGAMVDGLAIDVLQPGRGSAAYVAAIWTGAVISTLTLAVLLGRYLQEKTGATGASARN